MKDIEKVYKRLCYRYIAVFGQFCFTVSYFVVFFVATCSHGLPVILLGVFTHTQDVQFKKDIKKTSNKFHQEAMIKRYIFNFCTALNLYNYDILYQSICNYNIIL